LIAAGLVPLTVAPFAAGSLNPAMDATLCALMLVHSHMGFQSIIIDYIPKDKYPKSRAVSWWGLRAATVLVAIGLYEFETNDVGVTEAIKRIWKA
jgi:succinate dehydrogenase (ubiquinone) membrane anchor subunit